MKLNFFADHCVSNFIINELRKSGHNVLCLKDHIPPDSPDVKVLATAIEHNCILLSLNGDFADIVTFPASKHRGVIALQIKNHPEIIPDVMRRLLKFLSDHTQMDEFKGKLIVVEPHRIRVRY